MPPKRNRPLHDQQGLAMILVLCLGALFVALAAALVYAASLMMANADRQLPEQDVYELAVSFSDVLEQELLHYEGGEKNGDSLGYFINNTYVRKGGLNNVYGDDTDHVFSLQAPQGVDEMSVTLRKTLSEEYGEDETENTSESNILVTFEIQPGVTDLQNQGETLAMREESYKSKGIADYDISVTVKAKKDDETYAVTRKYRHIGMYEIYYTIDNGTAQWTFSGFKKDETGEYLLFEAPGNQTRRITATDAVTLDMRYHIEDDAVYACKFERITTND